ncbi:MAG: hypothetical protein JW818_13310, partial [Pirellulales bacterium]|nr:hypothetical protein [Pirellulales bacterium]
MRMPSKIGLALVAVAATLAAGVIPSAQADTVPSLLHHYQFDGTYDSATSSVVADPLGTTTPVGTTGGISGGAAYFNGTDSMLLLEGQGVLPAGTFTVSFWEKADTPAAGTYEDGYFLCDAAANPLQSLYLRRYPTPDAGGTTVAAANGFIAMGQLSPYVTDDLSTGVWHQHTITHTASGSSYWWIDGALQKVSPTGDLFSGLTAINPSTAYDREGLLLGNR